MKTIVRKPLRIKGIFFFFRISLPSYTQIHIIHEQLQCLGKCKSCRRDVSIFFFHRGIILFRRKYLLLSVQNLLAPGEGWLRVLEVRLMLNLTGWFKVDKIAKNIQWRHEDCSRINGEVDRSNVGINDLFSTSKKWNCPRVQPEREKQKTNKTFILDILSHSLSLTLSLSLSLSRHLLLSLSLSLSLSLFIYIYIYISVMPLAHQSYLS